MRKKGFTLIELLAVIVILAVISLIATPMVLKYIDKMEKEALKNDIRAIDKAIFLSAVEDRGDKTFTSTDQIDVKIKNTEIKIIYSNGINKYYKVENKKYMLDVSKCENDYCTIEEINKIDEIIIKKRENIVYEKVNDSNPGIICGNEKTEDASVSICYIKSIEDLVAFSNLVNSGNDFAGKTIELSNNLNFSNVNSYVSKKINNDLTSGEGFTPIGNNSNQFKGTFDGNNKIINSLYINKSNNNYVGLFGYLNGATVKDLTLDNLTVNAIGYVGGLAGYKINGSVLNISVKNANIIGTGNNVGGVIGSNIGNGKVSNVFVRGDVKGINNVGLVVGYNSDDAGAGTSSTLNNLISQGNVEGSSYVGGLVGYVSCRYGNATNVSGVFLNGSVVGTSNAYATMGTVSNYATIKTLSSSEVLVNGLSVNSTAINSQNGMTVNKELLKDINVYELVFDTYIGGDNDSDGYYADYLSNGEIGFKSTNESPLVFDLKQEGDYYLIKTYSDLKKAALKPSYKYKLVNDIDLDGEKYYMLGSENNNFTGSFDGNNKTISNVYFKTISGGLFGKTSSANISNLKLSNITIIGADYVGLISGNSLLTTINNVEINKAKINGGRYVGGLIAKTGPSQSENAISNIKYTNLKITGKNYVGGIVGYKCAGTINYVNLENIEIIATGDNVGGIAGYNSLGTISTVLINGQVTGSNRVGLIIGCSEEGSVNLTQLVSRGNVKGNSYVGGLIGYFACRYGNATNVSGAFLDGSVSGTANTFRTMGMVSPYATINTLAFDTITINGSPANTLIGLSNKNGKSLSKTGIASQPEYEAIGFEFDSTNENDAYWYFDKNDNLKLAFK